MQMGFIVRHNVRGKRQKRLGRGSWAADIRFTITTVAKGGGTVTLRAHAIKSRLAIMIPMERRAIIALGVVMCCRCALALNPSLDVSQYAHTAWKFRDGFTKGTIVSIAQTPDGYLWLGTEFGLLRFDGVRSVPWQ